MYGQNPCGYFSFFCFSFGASFGAIWVPHKRFVQPIRMRRRMGRISCVIRPRIFLHSDFLSRIPRQFFLGEMSLLLFPLSPPRYSFSRVLLSAARSFAFVCTTTFAPLISSPAILTPILFALRNAKTDSRDSFFFLENKNYFYFRFIFILMIDVHWLTTSGADAFAQIFLYILLSVNRIFALLYIFSVKKYCDLYTFIFSIFFLLNFKISLL